jgi:predicted house-cleaning noncanonical NTP pyrophosphatase (MazG superfamily)
MKYNKLVRDKIPNIIKKKGDVAKVHIASKSEFEKKLNEKLLEEVKEYLENNTKEELADVLEVVYSICKNKKINLKSLEKTRVEKAKSRGSFNKRIILDETN